MNKFMWCKKFLCDDNKQYYFRLYSFKRYNFDNSYTYFVKIIYIIKKLFSTEMLGYVINYAEEKFVYTAEFRVIIIHY